MERLLNAGANPNSAIATGETPLMTCAGTGTADAVRNLIARGAAVNAAEPSQGQWYEVGQEFTVIYLPDEEKWNARYPVSMVRVRSSG